MECYRCGKPLEPTQAFCPACGQRSPIANAATPPPATTPAGWASTPLTSSPVPPTPYAPPGASVEPPVSSRASAPELASGIVALVMAGWAILRLDREAIRSVGEADAATKSAVQLLAVLGAIVGFLSALFMPGPRVAVIVGAIVTLVLYVIATFVVSGIVHAVCTTMGGKGEYLALFRCLAAISVLDVVSALPRIGLPLSFLATIWGLVALVPILEELYALARERAMIVAVGLGMLALVVLSLSIAAAKFTGTPLPY